MITMANPTPADVQTYLNNRQQAEAMQRTFAQMPKQEVDFGDAVRAGLDTALADLTGDAKKVESGYLDTIETVGNIKSRITAGDLDVDAAKHELRKVRQRLSSLNKTASRVATQAARIEADRKDPDARAAALIEKYPGLRR